MSGKKSKNRKNKYAKQVSRTEKNRAKRQEKHKIKHPI